MTYSRHPPQGAVGYEFNYQVMQWTVDNFGKKYNYPVVRARLERAQVARACATHSPPPVPVGQTIPVGQKAADPNAAKYNGYPLLNTYAQRTAVFQTPCPARSRRV